MSEPGPERTEPAEQIERIEQIEPVAIRRVVWGGFLLLAVALPLWFASTGHTWEDYYITVRFSENLATGKGLVYHEGERVHGFTSPLGVLLPAACRVVSGPQPLLALWLFRLLCIAAYVGGGALLLRAAQRNEPRSLIFVGSLFLLEAKTLAFTINGMETAFVVLFLMLCLWALAQEQERWLPLGIGFAGLMWSRPDSCVTVAGLGVVFLAFSTSRRDTLRTLLKAAALCTVLYLPWFLGAWIYYGTPVPHTVVAKARGLVHLERPIHAVFQRAGLMYAPPYANLGGWPAWVMNFSAGLSAVGACYWLIPGQDRLGRGASLLFLLLCGYLLFVPTVYPWYYPPAALCGLVAVGSALGRAVKRSSETWQTGAVGSATAVIGLFLVFSLWQSVQLLGTQYREIERGVRIPIGRYLRTQIKPGDRIFLECVGYIGYYSQGRIMDYPGLVSPQTVAIRREHHATFPGVVAIAEPEWLVLRPHEAKWVFATTGVRDRYRLMQTFDANPRLNQLGDVYGRGYLRWDATFHVFRRLADDAP